MKREQVAEQRASCEMGGRLPRRHSILPNLQEMVAEPIMTGLIAAGWSEVKLRGQEAAVH